MDHASRCCGLFAYPWGPLVLPRIPIVAEHSLFRVDTPDLVRMTEARLTLLGRGLVSVACRATVACPPAAKGGTCLPT